MKTQLEKLSPTNVLVTINVDENTLLSAKQKVVTRLAKQVKVAGFRAGHVPPAVAEKHLDQSQLQAEVIDEAMNIAYGHALQEHDIRPVLQPKVELKKFVPFSELVFTATIDVLGEIKLGDYKKIRKTMPKAVVTSKDVDQVIDNVRLQLAEKKEVARAAAEGDEVWIDFEGVDAKKQPVQGAKGTDYPLALGSNTFIPGFENNLVGIKAGEETSFTLTFPKDYGVKALSNRKVTFHVTVKTVKEVVKPEIDQTFAAKVGPFSSVDEMKADIKKQLQLEKERTIQRDFEADVINEITSRATVDLPVGLIDEQAEAVQKELQQSIAYRGLTYQEYLDQEGKDQDTFYKENILPEAERRLKAGLVLSEIAHVEKLTVTDDELADRIRQLKSQHASDRTMLSEIDKPENQRDIMARLLTEKTIATVVSYVSRT